MINKYVSLYIILYRKDHLQCVVLQSRASLMIQDQGHQASLMTLVPLTTLSCHICASAWLTFKCDPPIISYLDRPALYPSTTLTWTGSCPVPVHHPHLDRPALYPSTPSPGQVPAVYPSTTFTWTGSCPVPIHHPHLDLSAETERSQKDHLNTRSDQQLFSFNVLRSVEQFSGG